VENPKCRCDYANIVIKALTSALSELVSAPGALSILRNGGWEQWIRNHVLVALDYDRVIGFNEGQHKKTKRADLIFFCRGCEANAFGVEVKTNYVVQGTKTIDGRINEGIEQLRCLISDEVPAYLFYALPHLRGTAPEDLVKAQNTQHTVWYKHFKNARSWPDGINNNLPKARYLARKTSDGISANHSDCRKAPSQTGNTDTQCVAEVRAWLALVESDKSDDQGRKITFFDENAEAFSQKWIKGKVIYGRGKKKREVEEWQPA
jgi:hypothetical protein